jgi:hypothetical protein
VRALEAGVVRLYGVVVAVVGYSGGVHSALLFFCGPEPGSAGTLAGLND